ncbi:MAG: hypothetical protein ACYDHM_10610 [Acidiferrobacterales bacterium]
MVDEESGFSKEDLDAPIEELMRSPSYRLAYEDADFLDSDVARLVRLQLELMKPDMFLRRHNVRSTVVVLGSTCIPSPALANAQLDGLLQQERERPADESLHADIARAAQAGRAIALLCGGQKFCAGHVERVPA